ncbi:hypothetical protein ABW19_dt0201671 [Dactylella cylindrospora]|nr:hypothetical protein ABW19_dt0201671 [Dactylella cylindrospora]
MAEFPDENAIQIQERLLMNAYERGISSSGKSEFPKVIWNGHEKTLREPTPEVFPECKFGDFADFEQCMDPDDVLNEEYFDLTPPDSTEQGATQFDWTDFGDCTGFDAYDGLDSAKLEEYTNLDDILDYGDYVDYGNYMDIDNNPIKRRDGKLSKRKQCKRPSNGSTTASYMTTVTTGVPRRTLKPQDIVTTANEAPMSPPWLPLPTTLTKSLKPKSQGV